ncbi:uncharacterized protein LOC135085961 [Ostrinia nubilalis]|uniref:uncharacterized protein LOC135085961 n=1 Tax=Ostrinia nubilalis TaxID=29057 RepID=UPI00308234A7
MESLLQRQHDIVEAIKKVERNFNKDSAIRKTRKYLDERLDTLDKLWAEFQGNDHKLSSYENDKDPYFVEDQYRQARTYFDSVRNKISSFPPASETAASISPAPATLPKFVQPETVTLPTPPKLQPRLTMPSTSTALTTSSDQGQAAELLSLQQTNFRAFHRQVRSLRIDDIRDKWELEDELRNIQTRWSAIDALHLQIDNILQGSNTQYDDEFYAYEESYKGIKKALNLKLASTVHLQQSTPQIDIPTFTGKYTQWPTFYDMYVESIHNNNLLTNTQKMQHLKGKLRGDAERLIQHLHISADNYETAWELLTHRYNNPQLLFTKQIEIFINQPAAHKQSAFEIRRLYDTSMECIHAIQNLGIDTSTWDPLLVHLIAKKLDTETYSDYKEARKSLRDLPSLSELMNFLESKFNALEPISTTERQTSSSNKNYQQKMITNKKFHKPQSQNGGGHHYKKFENREFQAIATCSTNCPICNNNHYLYRCSKFMKLSPDERLLTVLKLEFCQNCLYAHEDSQCTSPKRCKVCKKPHNTALHEAYANVNLAQQSSNRPAESTRSSPVPTTPITNKLQISTHQDNKQHIVNHVATNDEEILLTTISIKVKTADGTYVTLRALLDQGSQISLISENAAQMLGLPRQRYHASVSGIGNGSKQGKGVVTLTCQSIYEDYELTTQALVIKHVINNLPNVSFNKQSWPHLQHIQLADPEYNISRPIDLLLDASVYSDIIMSGLIKGSNVAPIAQQTRMGWILSGNVKTFNCHVIVNNLSDISQYWELEGISDSVTELTQQEQYCEQVYKSTTRRLSTGRYEVAIPMKPGFEQDLGQSKSKAIAQFHNMEGKMSRNKEFCESYKQFLREYEQQGHMSLVTKHNEKPSCYLPHHGVLKIESTTTKLRTVFNASSKTSTGRSLNDLMERGPNLQKDLQHLILVWRQHKYVITADIEKMFRQINIREPDQHLQRIIWRSTPLEPLKEYQLTTVTYGTKAAPYLAMRTLKQLALDDAHKFPLAAAALMSSFYMDDLLEGCDEISQAKQLQQEIIDILKGAGMNIRKWSSNTHELIEDWAAEQLDAPLDFKSSENRKTLGLRIEFTPDYHDDEWRSMETQIRTLKEQENAPLSIHDVHQYSVLYTILGLIIVAGCIFMVMRWRRIKGALNMETSSTQANSIPMTAVASVDQAAATPPRTRPRSVRLDIPSINVVQ